MMAVASRKFEVVKLPRWQDRVKADEGELTQSTSRIIAVDSAHHAPLVSSIRTESTVVGTA